MRNETRYERNARMDRGNYGTGLGTIVAYIVLAAVLTLIIRWVC